MTSALTRTFNNDSLYGHFLTNSPKKVWNAATNGDLVLYQRPDPGTAQRRSIFFEDYKATTERHPNGNEKVYAFGTNFLPAKYIELFFRFVLGAVFTAALCVTAAPLGFAIKTIHLLGLYLTNGRVNAPHEDLPI